MVSRNQAMFESLGLLQNRLTQYTDVLHEYFLPHDQLVPFIDKLRIELGRHDAELLNASIRTVHQEDIALDYAQGERFSLVLYLSQETTDAGNADMARLTRSLIDAALDHSGTFYLPYQQHYTREQIALAYPQIDDFFATKRRYDPALLFQNSLFVRYALVDARTEDGTANAEAPRMAPSRAWTTTGPAGVLDGPSGAPTRR
jgi:hypothetical protein